MLQEGKRGKKRRGERRAWYGMIFQREFKVGDKCIDWGFLLFTIDKIIGTRQDNWLYKLATKCQFWINNEWVTAKADIEEKHNTRSVPYRVSTYFLYTVTYLPTYLPKHQPPQVSQPRHRQSFSVLPPTYLPILSYIPLNFQATSTETRSFRLNNLKVRVE